VLPLLCYYLSHSLDWTYTGISSAPILILIALFERRLFPSLHYPPSPPLAAHVESTRALRRFAARADLEALLDLFAERHGDDGVETPVLSQHRSCSLSIESEAPEESDKVIEAVWQKELKERLGRIEAALLELKH
jgi:hypothetical protein